MNTLRLPDGVRDLLRPLVDADAYLVGGTVRDLLLSLEPADVDIAVNGDGLQKARAFADATGGSLVVLDDERQMARVVLQNNSLRYVDIATLRGPDIVADLAARDITIDAIAAPLSALIAGAEAELIDPHSGIPDLRRRLIRLVSEQALIDDPLRLLRIVRLAVQLDFQIDDETKGMAVRNASHIDQAAFERQRDELVHSFAGDHAARAIRLLNELGLLDHVFPEVVRARGVTQPKEHYYDVFEHLIETVAALDFMLGATRPQSQHEAQLYDVFWNTIEARDATTRVGLRAHLDEEVSEGRSRRSLLKIAGLLHDVAKPETRAPDATGRIRFFGHAELGATTARSVLRRFRFSKRESDLCAIMVEEHLRPTQLGQPGELPSRRALYRFFRDTGDAAESVLLLSLADALAARGPNMTPAAWQGYVAYIGYVLARRNLDPTVVRPVRLLTGSDIMTELQIEPSREVGRLLAALEEAQAAGEVSTTSEAREFVRRLHRQSFRSGKEVAA